MQGAEYPACPSGWGCREGTGLARCLLYGGDFGVCWDAGVVCDHVCGHQGVFQHLHRGKVLPESMVTSPCI